jgi:WD40 repeat protein
MKLNNFISLRMYWILLAASAALAVLPAGVTAFPAPTWMQGGHAAGITGLACSPDGALIASASEDGTIKLWSTNGNLLRTLNTQPYPTTALAWSPDGTRIAAGTYSGGAVSGSAGPGLTFLWQAPSGWTNANVSLVRMTTNRFGKVTALAFSADNTKLASGCAAGSNLVHSVASGSVVASCPAYKTSARPAAVTSVAFSSQGLMASGCEDSTIRVYNSSWSQAWSSNSAHQSNATAVAFSPDGTLLATASQDKTIKIWLTSSWTLTQTLDGHTNGLVSLAFSPDGQKIVSGCVDGTVKIWDRPSGACLLTIAAHPLPVTAALFSPDGLRVITGSDDYTVRIWSANDGAAILTLGGQLDYVGSVAFSPDGAWCASAGGGQTIQVWNTISGALACALPGHTGCVTAIAFAPDSAVLASSGGPLDPTLKLWRLSDGAVLRTISASTNGLTALAFSPDGTILASGGDFSEQCIQLWKVGDGSLLRTLAGHTNGVTALAFSQDGSLLASGGRRFDSAIKIWSVADGALAQSLSGHSNNIESIAFAPDGGSVASGSSGTRALRIWQVANGSSRNLGNGTNPVVAVAFSPDGATLAASSQNTVQFWDVATGTLSETVVQETIRPSSIAYSPNGNLFLCGREDGTVLLSANTRGALGQPPLTFTSFRVDVEGTTTISASVQPWTHYVLQTSTNLQDWSSLAPVVSSANTLTISGPAISNSPAGYYRSTTPP